MARPPLIPIRDFFRDPERAGPTVSPDGKKIAYLKSVQGRLNVFVRTLGGDDERQVTDDRQRSIMMYTWARDGQRILYQQDQGGNEDFHVHVVDVDQGPSSARDLTPFEGVRAMILRLPRSAPQHALVTLNRRNPALMDVHRIDLDSGEVELVAENPGGDAPVSAWIVDHDDLVRAAVAQLPTGQTRVLARDTDVDDFRMLKTYDVDDLSGLMGTGVFGFTADGTGLLVGTADGSDRARLGRLDVVTGEETILDAHDDVDVAGAVISDKTGRLLAAVYLTHEGREVRPFDDDFGRDLGRAGELQHGYPQVLAQDDSEQLWVVGFNHDRQADAYYLFDRATGDSTLLFRARPWLDPAHLTGMRPVAIEARDGLELPCYLTLPEGVEPRNLPLVLLVHGGPWSRDLWGFHPEVQFLANRGYAVLQVNYRGSTGFGKGFVKAAEKQWARAMHDDLIDGVEWAIGAGIADRERVAIYGGSYGGYATLCGVTFTPDVFAAAFDYVGPSNLFTLIRSFPAYWGPMMDVWYRHVGDPDDPEQQEDLRGRSPLFFADRITTPLVVAQGANDPRVTKVESDQIVEALRERGVEVTYIVKDDEGHGFLNEENRLELYEVMERFFAEHLGGRAP